MPTSSGDTQDVLVIYKVRFQGQEVAAVVAIDPYIAWDALDLIDVDYEQLPSVTSPQQALAAGAPLIRDDKEGQADNRSTPGSPVTRRRPTRRSRPPTSSSASTRTTRGRTRLRWRRAGVSPT